MAQPIANSTYSEPRLLIKFPGGLNQNENPDIGEASEGWNFELGARQTEYKPRKPFDLLGTSTNGGAITGICQLITRSNVETTLVFSGDTCYLWDGSSTFTSKGSITDGAKIRDTYWSLDDYLIMTDVNQTTHDNVKMWDGTTFQDLPTGLGVSFSAKYSVVHLNRVWFFNVWVNGVHYPHMIIASAFEDPQTLDNTLRGGATNVGGGSFSTGLEAFYLLSPDLKAINGATVFQNALVISTDAGQIFVLSGTQGANFIFTPFFTGSSAIGTEAMANVGNDVIYVRKGGNINLLRSTQYFGDVRANDISRWIPTHTKDLTDALIVYEQDYQKVYFFVTDMVLVLFKDILYGQDTDTAVNAGLSPWSVYKTDHTSSFNTNAAKYMYLPGTTTYTVIWGDNAGHLFDMNGTGASGDAGSYQVNTSRTTRLIDETVINPFPWASEILLGKVQYHRDAAQSTLNLSFSWSDEYNVSTSAITLKGPTTGNTGPCYNRSSYYNDSAYYSQGFQFSDTVSNQHFSPSGKGPGFYLTLGNQGTTQWRIDHLELY